MLDLNRKAFTFIGLVLHRSRGKQPLAGLCASEPKVFVVHFLPHILKVLHRWRPFENTAVIGQCSESPLHTSLDLRRRQNGCWGVWMERIVYAAYVARVEMAAHTSAQNTRANKL